MSATLRTRPSLPQLGASTDRRRPGAKRADVLEHSFYFLMSLLIAIVVLYGFSHTVKTGLISSIAATDNPLLSHRTVHTSQDANVKLR